MQHVPKIFNKLQSDPAAPRNSNATGGCAFLLLGEVQLMLRHGSPSKLPKDTGLWAQRTPPAPLPFHTWNRARAPARLYFVPLQPVRSSSI